MAEERLYRLAPLDASGLFLGLSVVQCVCLGVGLMLVAVGVSAGLPIPVALMPLAVAAGVSFARVGGHAVWEWVPLAAGWVWAGLARGHRWAAPLPLWPTDAEKAPPLPPCLAGLDVLEVPWRTGNLGTIHDHERHTLTAVLPVRAQQFVAEARDEQEQMVARWGDVLAQFATDQSVVTHLSWSALARPSGLRDHLSWLAGQPPTNAPPAAMASYEQLLALNAPMATTHDVVVTVTVARDRLGRRSNTDGNGRVGADERLGLALATAVEALLRAFHSADLETSEPLAAAELQRMLRTHIDPARAVGRGSGGVRLGERLGVLTPSCASGPLVLEASWRQIRVDGALHRTWWVASWPRLAVPPSWLEPFLSADGVKRTMTVVLMPISTHQSRRRIERDLVRLESDASTKEERGRRVDARHQRATEALMEREQELVSGFAEMAYVGLVSVAAVTEEELEEHAEIVEQAARETGMELRVLDGRQDIAWAAALPLGLAPHTLLAS